MMILTALSSSSSSLLETVDCTRGWRESLTLWREFSELWGVWSVELLTSRIGEYI
ncbi:hypothetical protein RchiOBHm_Chr4g0419071 [Rosa chinensis]|uniref:Uncharacterized protein n=1 Tax=Rosa chinensis TaxID=74649 RepID=A0A2P6QXK7_ROSCH|nr:hypothetical protein RchiOBHm_Chr4g0419071 [Rosa chinensis]